MKIWRYEVVRDIAEMLDVVATEQQILFQQKGVKLIYNKPEPALVVPALDLQFAEV